jgi:predicted helicase
MDGILPNEQIRLVKSRYQDFYKYPELRKAVFNVFSNGIQTGKDYILYDFTTWRDYWKRQRSILILGVWVSILR